MKTCKKCEINLVSKVEIDSYLCANCIPIVLGTVAQLSESLEMERKKNSSLTDNIESLISTYNKRTELQACYEGGKEAFEREFDLDQDPHVEDSEESTMWCSGWVEAARLKEAEEMRDYIRWDFELWTHVHELAANGCDHEEIRVKSTIAPVRAMKFLPELLDEGEHKF